MRLVVCDTGPLLHLAEAGGLGLLRYAGELHIPPAVQAELSQLDAALAASIAGWVHVTQLAPPHQIAAESWRKAGLLHWGEAEALELARQLRAD